jgi:hypothetical protein
VTAAPPGVIVSDILAAIVLARRRLVLLSSALPVAAWVVVAVVGGADAGLLYLAPALVWFAPLVGGRCVGEQRLAALARRAPRADGSRPARRALSPEVPSCLAISASPRRASPWWS